MDALGILEAARANGVTVEMDDGQLIVQASKSKQPWINAIAKHSQAIKNILSDTPTPQDLKSEHQAGPQITTLEEATLGALDAVRNGRAALLETGIPMLDHALSGGYRQGELIVIAARPSHGKSAVGLQMLQAATGNELNCLLISQEMSHEQIGMRSLQFVSNFPEEYWKDEADSIENEIESHYEKRETCRVVSSCESITAAVKQVKQAIDDLDIKLAVIDYAQLVQGKGGSEYEKVSSVSKAFQAITKQYGVTIVLLCQLNREVDGRKKFEPQMSDIKGSGQFEQDADVILLLVWCCKQDESAPPKDFRITVAKNRNRAIRTPRFTIEFDPARQRLTDTFKFKPDNYNKEFQGWE